MPNRKNPTVPLSTIPMTIVFLPPLRTANGFGFRGGETFSSTGRPKIHAKRRAYIEGGEEIEGPDRGVTGLDGALGLRARGTGGPVSGRKDQRYVSSWRVGKGVVRALEKVDSLG